jgi:VWFA-related protein
VDLITLDVTVLDLDRRPIRGLSVDDFVILEDGKAQAVTAFQAIEHEAGPVATAAWLKAPPVDVAVNRHDEGRLLVLVIDDATLPHDAYMIRRARDTARSFVESLGPGDLCAIVFTRDNRHAQDFTRDRSRLLAAANRASSGFLGAVGGSVGIGARAPEVNTDLNYYLSSLNTLSRVAEHLEAVSARRKTIAYLSIGVLNRPGFFGGLIP